MNSLISRISMQCVRQLRLNITNSNAYGQSGLFTHITNANQKGQFSHFLPNRALLYEAPKATVGSRDTGNSSMGELRFRSSSATSTAAATTAARRLKREDFRNTKHDHAFSQWKILITATAWKDHAMGKEGAENYSTQNLPNSISCAGVYELAVAMSGARKLDSSSVITVYVGEAENVRTRLQQYGRDGSHLENGCSNDEFNNWQNVSSLKVPGLFSDIFSKGYSIAYRCAPMASKKDAEKTEKQLLDTFDYPWNKDMNGVRRKDDVFRKLERRENASRIYLLAKKYWFSNRKQVGVRIKTCEPLMKNGSNIHNKDNNNVSFSRIFGIKRLQAMPVQYGNGDDCTEICGVAIGHGSICTTPPVKGRKRCAEHKGMRVNGYISKLNADGESPPSVPPSMGSGLVDESQTICGYILHNGSPCKKNPVPRNKRCLDHKGRRICRSEPNFKREEIGQIHEVTCEVS
ncbi:hypothetical protein ACJIZ3_021283 [Penstemon smallii]|uniref:GIY-YIG domain-containing protein n=1 Tax=Penstemon smallii TaxID=265156 RepID=A0ABD3SL49_9LAMI